MSTAFHTAHFFCAAYMTGVIWFVQLVQYPMLHLSGGGHREYTRRMGVVVLPVMLLELALQIRWTWQAQSPIPVIGLVFLGAIWASTFFLQVPCHRKLERAFNPEVQRHLVRTNWIRTVLWTARAVLIGI